MLKIGILEPDSFSEKALANLKKAGKVTLFKNTDITAFLADKDILFVRLKHSIDKKLLTHCNSLKYICSPTTGLNHIDTIEAKKRNIKIISLQGEKKFLSQIRATPEHTLGLTLSLLRNYKTAFLTKENHSWDRDKHRGTEVFKNKVGIIGYGRVGRILAQYFRSMGAEVFFYDVISKYKSDRNAKKVSNLNDLIKTCTIIILCVNFEEINRKMIGKQQIDLMKAKFFVNTSRGELVDEGYLIRKISAGHFSGVALDVIQNEQHPNDLKKLINVSENRNVIITPHIGGATYTSMWLTEEFITEKLQKYY